MKKEVKERLQDYEFVDMMEEIDKAEKQKEAAEKMIETIFSIYKMTKVGFSGRREKMLKNSSLEDLIAKYKKDGR